MRIAWLSFEKENKNESDKQKKTLWRLFNLPQGSEPPYHIMCYNQRINQFYNLSILSEKNKIQSAIIVSLLPLFDVREVGGMYLVHYPDMTAEWTMEDGEGGFTRGGGVIRKGINTTPH